MKVIDYLKKSVERPLKLALIILVVMGIIYGIFMGVNFLPGKGSHVILEDKVYFEVIDNTILRITTYVTNDGLTDSGHVKLTAFVKDSAGLSQSKCDEEVGVIPSETTREVVLTTTVPLGRDYSIDILVFESGKKLELGTGGPKAPSGYGAGEWQLSKQRVTEKPGVPGFEALPLIGAFAIALLIFKKLRKK